MPVEVKAYRCKWKCGKRSTTNLKAMLRHEETCFSNPVRRACETCAYNGGKCSEDDYTTTYIDCGNYDNASPMIDTHGIACDCPGWMLKPAD